MMYKLEGETEKGKQHSTEVEFMCVCEEWNLSYVEEN